MVASLNIPLATDTKKPITEDMITEAIAEDVGIPYVKIDPLKLNLDVVTSHVPRPFAQKYLVVPLEEKDKVVTIAVATPLTLRPVDSLNATRKMKIKVVLSSKATSSR